jgi:hypothetical protein
MPPKLSEMRSPDALATRQLGQAVRFVGVVSPWLARTRPLGRGQASADSLKFPLLPPTRAFDGRAAALSDGGLDHNAAPESGQAGGFALPRVCTAYQRAK